MFFRSSRLTHFVVQNGTKIIRGGGGGGWTGQNLKVKIWFLTLHRSNINIQIYEMYPFCHVFHYLTLIYLFTYMLNSLHAMYFFMLLLSPVDLFNELSFRYFFREHYQSVKQVGSRSGPTFCRSWSGSKLFAKVISRRQNSSLAGKELNNLTLRETVVNECCSNWRLCQVMR